MEGIITKYISREKLPLVVEPYDKNITFEKFLGLLELHKKFFKQNLLSAGGLLFRGFPINHQDDFTAILKTLELGEFLNYVGGDSPRTKVSEGVYTSTEAPPSIKIPLHNELSFVKYHPKYICFYCVTPSETGGETILGDARKIYNAVRPDVRERFIKNGLKYVSSYYYKSQLMDFINQLQRSHKSWIQVFETDSREEVEQKCRENEFDLKWSQDDWIQISQQRPAVYSHPSTGENVWFNQAHLYDFNPRLLGWWRYIASKILYSRKHTRLHEIYFSNSAKVPRSDIYHILDVLDANTIAFPWQKGDVLVLDNVLAMHGRATFTGKRRILTAMCG